MLRTRSGTEGRTVRLLYASLWPQFRLLSQKLTFLSPLPILHKPFLPVEQNGDRS